MFHFCFIGILLHGYCSLVKMEDTQTKPILCHSDQIFIKDVFKLNKNYETNHIVTTGVYEIPYSKAKSKT